MSRVIKKSAPDLGDIEPGTGFVEVSNHNRKVISGEAYEAKAEAQTILERAQADAERMITDAHEEAERIKAEAYDEAKSTGYDEGRQQGIAEFSELVADFARRMRQIEDQAIPQLRDLALKIARKILGRELEFHPDAVIDIVKQALTEKARLRREVFLRVNPEDLAMIREHKADLVEVLSRCKEIGLREDPDVTRGGCIIETDAGIIDAQLETQLAVFERVLKDVR